jgi:pyruvate/2-oxoglutarate dehydrogenase complex dihydrolipoamide acyltransferase (E2) component
MNTTLNKIRSFGPSEDFWKKLLTYLGKTKADDEPLSIETILDSNGLEDALWCLRTVDGHGREIRLFAVWCAKQVEHLMTDPRSIAALDVAEAAASDAAGDGAGDGAAWVALVAAAAARDAAASAAGADAAKNGAELMGAAVAAAAARRVARENQANKLREICSEIRAKGDK